MWFGIQVYVVMAETLRFLAGVRECSLSDTLYLPVAVQGRLPGGHLADLTRCDSVGLTVSTDSERYSAELAGKQILRYAVSTHSIHTYYTCTLSHKEEHDMENMLTLVVVQGLSECSYSRC